MNRAVLLLLFMCLGTPCAFAQAIVAMLKPGEAAAVDSVAHRAYMISYVDASIWIAEGESIGATIALPAVARQVVVDERRDRAYVALADGSLVRIDGATKQVTPVATGITQFMTVNDATGKVFAATHTAGEVAVIDEASGARSSIASGAGGICGLTVNPAADTLFVAGCGKIVSVVDRASSAAPGPAAAITLPEYISSVAVDETTNRAYVAGGEGIAKITVIDGTSKANHTYALPGSWSQGAETVVDSGRRRLYVTHGADFLVVDATTDSVLAVIASPEIALRPVLDAAFGRVYTLARGSNYLLAFDPAGGTVAKQALPIFPSSLALDSSSHLLYASGVVIDGTKPPGAPMRNYQGMWWNPHESGWGVDIAQQGDVLFAAWFTYASNGDPKWYVVPRLERTTGEAFAGPMYETTGPSFNGPWDSSRVTTAPAGSMSLSFSDGNNGTLHVVLNGTSVDKTIARQVWGSSGVTCSTGTAPSDQFVTDLWWASPAGSESGWGLFLTHQDQNIFAVWFTYVNGQPSWFVGSNIAQDLASSSGQFRYFRGPLYRTSGPPATASPWNASGVQVTPVGDLILTFEPGNTVMTWRIGSANGQKVLTREAFGSFRSSCP